jgi:hypothetical protein
MPEFFFFKAILQNEICFIKLVMIFFLTAFFLLNEILFISHLLWGDVDGLVHNGPPDCLKTT